MNCLLLSEPMNTVKCKRQDFLLLLVVKTFFSPKIILTLELAQELVNISNPCLLRINMVNLGGKKMFVMNKGK